MKGNRRIPDAHEVVDLHGLDKSKPPPDSLFFKMWDAAKSIGEAAYELDYLQGILHGNLDPTSYGAYNIADAYYCYHGADDYGVAAGRAPDGTPLKSFLLKKQKGYEKYNESFPDTWHLDGVASIAPPLAVKVYVGFEKAVCSLLDPVYGIVAMLPCEYLWYWLAHKMGTPKPGNLYASWITGNDYPGGAYAMGNFLDAYQEEHPSTLRSDEAIWLYCFATYCEYADFASGTHAVARKPSKLGLNEPTFGSSEGWKQLAALWNELES